MIYELKFEDGNIHWCTAKDQLHLLKSYDKEYDLSLQDIESIEEISEEDAKTMMVLNEEYDESDIEDDEYVSLYDLAVTDEFSVIASNEFD